VDKVLTLRGGPELVAIWGQLGSIIELVAGVALAGVGTGLSVLVAQAARPEDQRELLREALRIGLSVSVPVMIAVAAISWIFPDIVAGQSSSPPLLALSAVVGCIAVIPGMINGYWLGQQRRDLMLALAAVSAVLPFAAAMGTPQADILGAVAISYSLPALAALFITAARPKAGMRPQGRRHDLRALRGYVPAGLAIGALSPAAMLAARSIVSSTMSWHEAGLLQALWRVSDWVAAVAAGILSVHFLPRLSAAFGTPQFSVELKRSAWMTIVPAAVAFAVLLVFQRPVFALLYNRNVVLSDAAVVLFFAGSLVRIAAWVPLFALYAMRRTTALTLGEVLSMPLFALLLGVFSQGLTLEHASAMWLASYLAYGLFNLWAVRRTTSEGRIAP
jgi:polysaccharide transporter, PST family